MVVAGILAAVGPCSECTPAEPNSSLVFYQAAAAAFPVLLLTGIVGELRDIRSRLSSEYGPLSRALRAQLIGMAVLLAFVMAGELVALKVLLDPPAAKPEQIAVSVFLAITVTGIPILMLISLGEYRPREMRLVGSVVIGLVLLLVVGTLLYLVATALEKDPKTFTYHVYGTCAAGACGLNERKAASLESEPLGQLRDGDEVEVVCQKRGGAVEAPNGLRSKVWDKLSNGAFVSDVAVDTPSVGSQIPACEPPPPGSPRSG